jgi:K+/H+ antiporter YhaU regulatory subunit KhtT
MTGKTISDLDIRKATGVTVLSIRRREDSIPHPEPDTDLELNDKLYIVESPQQLTEFEEAFKLSKFCPLTSPLALHILGQDSLEEPPAE